MYYSKKTKAAVKASPRTQGSRLGRLAIKANYSVARVAEHIGASRPTVYKWFIGGPISPAYRASVDALIAYLK